MKADHPRAIDQYIDYFGNVARARSEALDTWRRPVHEPPGVERSDFVARDDSPRP
jgi:hypothetical protein